ncbi:unnamed protein product [Chilo suppressalis]|uniref:BRO1 domain-containing protein n=1 Tax=Chilo suppressalis TaxID=168631 RepID=A0ABN8ECE2_CHISP|nr:unnamed protein product [Chilo suppressalis]
MFSASAAVVAYVTVIFLTEVAPWTIDLPEVRRFYFEKYSNIDEKVPKLNENQAFFDNINGDSLYNTDRKPYEEIYNIMQHAKHYYHKSEQDDPKNNLYANAYQHGEYMMRKVSKGVLQHGSAYLDGLRLSVERYREELENCTRNNFTANFPPNMTTPLSIGNFTGWRDFQTSCRRATEASEHVRRLADLALWAARRLQDVAYAAKYSKDASMEENELLLRLAWYLDKLAHITGYEPSPEQFLAAKTEKTPPPPILPVLNPLNITEEMKQALLKCLQGDSKVPATERCAFPNPPSIADVMAALSNPALRTPPTTQPPAELPKAPIVSPKPSDNNSSDLKPELLDAVATDNREHLPSTLTRQKSVKKRSISDETNPLVKALKYYAKQKIWEHSNPKRTNEEDQDFLKSGQFDVENDLRAKHVQKRSVLIKNNEVHIPPPLHKVKAVVHTVAEKIKTVKHALEKAYAKKIHPPSAHVTHYQAFIPNPHHHFEGGFRRKRSIYTPNTYYGQVIQPRVPLNPQMDISYYVKNKEGTEYNANLAQAALLRASLEAVFQRGNIAVVHRYGANYNPAVPLPFYAGILRSTGDI